MSDQIATLDGFLSRPTTTETLASGLTVRVHKVSLAERDHAHKKAREYAAQQGKVEDDGTPETWDANAFAAYYCAAGLAEPRIPFGYPDAAEDRVPDLMAAKSIDEINELFDVVHGVTTGKGGSDVEKRVEEFPAEDAASDDGEVPAPAGEVLVDAGSSDAGSDAV